MSFANKTLGGIKGVGTDTNASLVEAEKILKELQERNFTTVMANATEEKELALNVSAVSKEMLKQAKHVEEKASQFNNTFKDLVQAFRNLKAASRMTKANADNASDVVDMAKTIEYKVSLILTFILLTFLSSICYFLYFFFSTVTDR